MSESMQDGSLGGLNGNAGQLSREGGSEEQLWQASAHLDAVLDSLSGYSIYTLDPTGHITSWNNGAFRTKGYTQAEIIGRHFSCFYTMEDQQAGAPARSLQCAIDTGKYEEEGWRIKKNGHPFWAHVVLQPITERSGKLVGFVKVTRDITQKLQLDKLREEVAQSQKQEMVAQLTGGVAHDFNNLLTAIDASHELIRRYSADERVQRVLRTNKAAIDRSRTLISQLLAFSRKQILHPRASNLHDLVTVFDVLLQKAVGETVRLNLDLMPAAPPVHIDQAQFQSALLNLIMNAREAMPRGGSVDVFMEMATVTGGYATELQDVPPGTYVVLGVKDTGIGMSEDVRKRAIEPFFTTKEVGRGPGLGLSQCYGFARQSGGTLSIQSKEGFGTTVRIFLPALSAQALEFKREQRAILVVDDDMAVRMLVSEMLRDLGHTVHEAEDARDALNQLHKEPGIDFLFSDIIMPDGMNGLELVQAARAVRPDITALLASGYPRDVLRDIAQLPEDVAFLQKPYSLADLSQHLGGRTRINLLAH